MYGRAGLDRFKKAETLEPFSVSVNSAYKPNTQSVSKPASSTSSVSNTHLQKNAQNQHQQQSHVSNRPAVPEAAPLVGQNQQVTQIGGGESTWQPPDWAIEPRAGVYFLEVLKDGVVLDKINLDRRRQIFGRQVHTCDFVLDHQSVSRQHAAVIPHKNGSCCLGKSSKPPKSIFFSLSSIVASNSGIMMSDGDGSDNDG